MPANTPHVNKHSVVLCWHMHQPDYRDANGHFQQPWTYLHAIKDYTDMAAHLERSNDCCVNINFTPILLDQLRAYRDNISCYFETANPSVLCDSLLTALVSETLDNDPHVRMNLLERCLKINQRHCIERYSYYAMLADFARQVLKQSQRIDYINEGLAFDLLVWYHLAWMGEFIKQQDFRFHRLVDQGRQFSMEHRRQVLQMLHDYLKELLQRYSHLVQVGKVELSMTPYAHPIAPLLMDLQCAKQAIPDIALPQARSYPGGEKRLRWHIERGLSVFEECFGQRPTGCWPAEGAIDDKSLAVLDHYRFDWVASGGMVLKYSLAPSLHSIGQVADECLQAVYQLPHKRLNNFFRNDELSDLIGFTYSSWHADDAVADLIHRLENIANKSADKPNSVTVIALDGENAWEYYPNNGFYFLQALYKRLSEHPRLRLTSFSQVLKASEPAQRHPLNKIIAGSWVYGNLATWIGDEEKNRAWDMLTEAKQCFDRAIVTGKLGPAQIEAAEVRLGVCEGSDWFWWFGDDNPAATTAVFDHLFRSHLIALYQLLDQAPPAYLAEPFTRPHAEKALPLGGTMRKAE